MLRHNNGFLITAPGESPKGAKGRPLSVEIPFAKMGAHVVVDTSLDMICLVAFDLEKVRITADAAVEKIQLIHAGFQKGNKGQEVPPSIVVFAKQLTGDERRKLHEAGAIIYDRSLASTPIDLDVHQLIGTLIRPPADSPARPAAWKRDADADPSSYDGYPPGVNEEAVADFFRQLNHEEQAPR